MAEPFRFKQFKLNQQKAAFKLGTDSVVLGSWLPVKSYARVLDIGAGTGILSLMVAQRFLMAQITAIELDAPSANDCANNFAQSKWSDRLAVVNLDVMDWSKLHPTEKFDLIITNPPYFHNSLQNPDERKSKARHSTSLTGFGLVDLVSQHLSAAGFFALILPVLEFDALSVELETRQVFAESICNISSFKDTPVIRKMGLFGFSVQNAHQEDQYLYNEDKSRSDWYKRVSEEFYVK